MCSLTSVMWSKAVMPGLWSHTHMYKFTLAFGHEPPVTVAEAGTSPLILQEIQPNLKPFPNTASVSESTSTQAPWQSQATGRTKHSVTETDIKQFHKTDAHFFVLNWQALLRQNLLYSFFSLHAFPFFFYYACWLFLFNAERFLASFISTQ